MDPGPASPTLSSDQRPRTRSRGISFRSDKSAGSDGKTKVSDSPREKAQRDSVWRGANKSNPNAAINEAQPGVRNVMEESTLQNLRDGQHRDQNGNLINDPDRSNPTRPRMERPLDTIRSFERAIDDGYKRRNSYMRQDSEHWDKENQFASRRSSYFGGNDNNSHGPTRSQQGGGGYYGSQSYYGPPKTRYSTQRMQSDPQLYGGGQRPYPQHGYHQSHDTVNTGMTNGSDSTGPWGNSTDPSSENSSIDKVNAMNKPPTPGNGFYEYGSNGYNGPIMEEQGGQNGYGQYRQDHAYANPANAAMREEYGQQAGPSNGYGPRDMHARNMSTPQFPPPAQPRQPIKLGESGADGDINGGRSLPPPPPAHSSQPEKKQGWLKRRFSKKA